MFSSSASSWNGLAALFAVSIVLAPTAHAQECDIKSVTTDGSDKLPDIAANFTCVSAKLNAALSRIERLEADLEAFRFAKNAVLAFNTDKNAPCPRGWKLFDEASGRFIVGAGFGDGLTPRNVKDKGGEEMHKLTEAEIPNHSHSVYQHAGYHWPDIPNAQKTQPNQGANGGDTTTYVHGGTDRKSVV